MQKPALPALPALLALPAATLAALVLALSACAASGDGPAAPLLGTTWQHGADGPQAAYITLDEKSRRVTGFGGCNRLTGPYTLDGSQLSFHNVASTRRACLNDDGSEDRFMAALAGVRSWRIEGRQLRLLSASGGTLLTLQSGAPRP